MEKIKAFKQFGQYRTGTCVTAIVVRKTFEVAVYVDQMGFKHNPLNQSVWEEGVRRNGLGNIDLNLLISIKHPYSWVVSMKNFRDTPLRRNPNAMFGGFALADGAKERRAYSVEVMCRNYNQCYRSWLNVEMPKFVVPFESLLSSLEDLMSDLAVQFGLEEKCVPELPRNVIAPHERVMNSALFDRSFYEEKRYMEMLSADDKKAADELIDWELIAPFGYIKD